MLKEFIKDIKETKRIVKISFSGTKEQNSRFITEYNKIPDYYIRDIDALKSMSRIKDIYSIKAITEGQANCILSKILRTASLEREWGKEMHYNDEWRRIFHSED